MDGEETNALECRPIRIKLRGSRPRRGGSCTLLFIKVQDRGPSCTPTTGDYVGPALYTRRVSVHVVKRTLMLIECIKASFHIQMAINRAKQM